MFIRFSFLWLLFVAAGIQAQQPATIHLTEKGRLPDIDFFNIIEDSEKFIWLAADKGLYRYNGRAYQYFSNAQQKGNAVFGTLEDSKGRIWCNNINGQFFYVVENDLQLFIDLSEILNGELSQFKVTDKELLVFTGKKIISVNIESKKVTLRFNKSNARIGLALKVDNKYLYTEENQIIQTDQEFNKTDSLYIDLYDTYGIESLARLPNIVSNGKVSFCHFIRYSENIFYQFNIKKKELKKITIPNALKKRSINQVFLKNDAIWIATDQGIQIFSIQNNALVLKQHFLSNYFITKIIIDSYENYWITTKGDGIFVMPSIYVFKYDLPQRSENINKLKNLGNSTILFGTNKGDIGTLNLNNDTSKTINSTTTFRVSEIIQSENSKEFIIVKEDAAFLYNTDAQTLKNINKPIIHGAKSLSKVNGLGYILSSYKNAVLLDNNFEIIKKLVEKRSYTNYYSETRKEMYIGTVEGFFVFNEQFKKTEIKHNGNPIAATSITESQDNRLWVSTFKNGIYEIYNNEVIAHYNKTNGLLSNKTGVLQSDDNGLWVTTEKGIQFLNLNTRHFDNLTLQNGIPSYRITDIEIIDSTVLFSSNSGLFGLYKMKVFNRPKRKDIYFSDVSVNETKQLIKPSYDLDYNENKIRFTYNVNGFQSGANTRYEYRLLGLEPTWYKADEQINTVTYTSLPSGNYTFQVKIVGEADTLKSIKLSISSPIWERWWFYLLVISVSGILIYLIFTSKIKALKIKQNAMLQKEIVNKQLVLSQLENLRSQMNPHFIFNALNSIQEYIVLNDLSIPPSFHPLYHF